MGEKFEEKWADDSITSIITDIAEDVTITSPASFPT